MVVKPHYECASTECGTCERSGPRSKLIYFIQFGIDQRRLCRTCLLALQDEIKRALKVTNRTGVKAGAGRR